MVYPEVEQRLARLINARQQGMLRGGLIGLEKEALRVASDGSLAQTPHPVELGSALTHPWITTDFSESQLELITPPLPDIRAALDFMHDLQLWTQRIMRDEFLWVTSMPCVVTGERGVPIARYGSSNAGRMKHVYRVGLGHRYGRVMQAIAGVHFNYSCNEALWPVFQVLEKDTRPLLEFIDKFYFGMIRNLQRMGWLIPYLFGSSPAVCKTFVGDQPTDMEWFDETTYYYPYATSLRMGDIGYQNNKAYESGFKARYDNIDIYIASLSWAIDTPCERYGKIGVVVDGEYRQLNDHILQIENEYYSTVRPKQILRGNEKPTIALRERGVRYVELRSLDLNPFDPLGMNESAMRFLEAFMLLCLLKESPRLGIKEVRQIDANDLAAAHKGRDPGLRLRRNGREMTVQSWGLEVLDAMAGICEVLDEGDPAAPYREALRQQRKALLEPERTPSARMLREMRDRGEGFHHYGRHLAEACRAHFAHRVLEESTQREYVELAKTSRQRQSEIEAADEQSFESYLEAYFAQA
ncbi:MAG: glutamate--cysteine ligase [Pseudomonadota bacterium]|nr:glutamate--cysteine ligase [Pseudomonadota bacterium]